jgi:hypothetical protein
VTDIFPRESGWDSSVREEPLGEWCSKHGFYACPVCRGEEPIWVIPIVDGSESVGSVVVHDGGEVRITGTIRLPTPAPEDFSHAWEPTSDPVRVTPSPDLIVQIKESFSTVESLLREPRHVEAAARGRKVHEDALRLVAERGIDYKEAIAEVLGGVEYPDP